MASHLASELARVQNFVRELEANMDHGDVPPAARAICGEMASRVDRSLRIARCWSEEGGRGGHHAPRNAAKDAHFKRRKGVPSVRKQVRVTSVRDSAAATDDGFSWRKYGQKDILGAKYPRSYFRCTHRNTRACPATRHVQRADADPLLFDVVYHGAHTCGVQKAAHGQQLQPAGLERSSPRVVETTGGVQLPRAGFEPVTPHSFSSAPAAAGADLDPLLSPASSDWQLRGGRLGAGMEFDQQQFDDLFSGPPDSFRWDV